MEAVKRSKKELQSEGRKWAGNNLFKHIILIQISTHTLTQEEKYKEKQRESIRNTETCAQRTNGESNHNTEWSCTNEASQDCSRHEELMPTQTQKACSKHVQSPSKQH